MARVKYTHVLKSEPLRFRDEEPKGYTERHTQSEEYEADFGAEVPGVGVNHVGADEANDPAAAAC